MYDEVNFTRKGKSGTGDDASTVTDNGGTATGQPMVAYGAITIGMKF